MLMADCRIGLMPACAIFGCGNYTRKTKGSDIRYYSFPKDENLCKQWINACCQKKRFNFTTGRICSKHFHSSAFTTTLKQELLKYKPKTARDLKQDAIPTEFLRKPKQSLSTHKNENQQKSKNREISVQKILEKTTQAHEDVSDKIEDIEQNRIEQKQELHKYKSKTAPDHKQDVILTEFLPNPNQSLSTNKNENQEKIKNREISIQKILEKATQAHEDVSDKIEDIEQNRIEQKQELLKYKPKTARDLKQDAISTEFLLKPKQSLNTNKNENQKKIKNREISAQKILEKATQAHEDVSDKIENIEQNGIQQNQKLLKYKPKTARDLKQDAILTVFLLKPKQSLNTNKNENREKIRNKEISVQEKATQAHEDVTNKIEDIEQSRLQQKDTLLKIQSLSTSKTSTESSLSELNELIKQLKNENSKLKEQNDLLLKSWASVTTELDSMKAMLKKRYLTKIFE